MGQRKNDLEIRKLTTPGCTESESMSVVRNGLVSTDDRALSVWEIARPSQLARQAAAVHDVGAVDFGPLDGGSDEMVGVVGGLRPSSSVTQVLSTLF